MKIKINDEELFELTEVQKKVICNDIDEEIFEEDCKRRLEWVLMHKYDQCLKRLKEEWEPRLSARVSMIPTDPEAFAKLVFSQPDYEDRKQRDLKTQ